MLGRGGGSFLPPPTVANGRIAGETALQQGSVGSILPWRKDALATGYRPRESDCASDRKESK